MIKVNKRFVEARGAERAADRAYRKKHGDKSKDDVIMKWVVGVPIVLSVFTFLVLCTRCCQPLQIAQSQ
ncbi:hypothetical protein AWB67_05296 [Caballeronia terrestris]|uniref:Uncharacterized protein n=1 Tax=Caballeronia terrestris TaxID=1226301 RepID=A0A158KBT5_9BURK|nr:hypothetical protein [Caballeronia terrestris]SAL78602.1 hypothetical protein AWB67_05296 [Caballeronia terrestris]